jgi:hypothetical protein
MNRRAHIIILLQIYNLWKEQLSEEVSQAVKTSCKISDYNFETMRVMISHELLPGAHKPTQKTLPKIGN